MSKMKTFQPGNFNNDIGGPMGLIVSRSWFVTTNHHLFSWPLLTFDCFNFSCWIVSLAVVQNKIILFQEAPPGVYDMTILAYFLTILRYWTIFLTILRYWPKKMTILRYWPNSADMTILIKNGRYYYDIDEKMDDITMLVNKSMALLPIQYIVSLVDELIIR